MCEYAPVNAARNATEKISRPAGPSVVPFLDLKREQQFESHPSAFIHDDVQPDYPVTTDDDYQSETSSTAMSLLYKATITHSLYIHILIDNRRQIVIFRNSSKEHNSFLVF